MELGREEFADLLTEWLLVNPRGTTLFGKSVNLYADRKNGARAIKDQARWFSDVVFDVLDWDRKRQEATKKNGSAVTSGEDIGLADEFSKPPTNGN